MKAKKERVFNLRIDFETLALLERLADDEALSKAAVLRRLIIAEWKRRQERANGDNR